MSEPTDGGRGFMQCRDYVLDALRTEQLHRKFDDDDGWIDRELNAITVAANSWATANQGQCINVDDVKRIEPLALGHVDYSSKLALYVAELVCHPPRKDNNGQESLQENPCLKNLCY